MLDMDIKIFGSLARKRFFSSIKYVVLIVLALIQPMPSAQAVTYQLGDLGPRNLPDGQLNAGDLVVLQRLIHGHITPSSQEVLLGDVAPVPNGDNLLNAADLLILERAILGDINLGTVDILDPPSINPVSSPPLYQSLCNIRYSRFWRGCADLC